MASWCKRNIIRPVRNTVLYVLSSFLFMVAPLIPRKWQLGLHGRLSRLVYRLSKKQSDIVVENLTKVYGPEREEGAYWRLGQRVFECLALTFTDYARWGARRSWSFFRRYFKVTGEEHLRAAYERGKGVLCLIPHTAGWEFSAILPPLLGYKTAGVSSRIKNPALNKLMIRHRESRGMRNITRNHCYDALVDLLRAGECLIIMTDQDSKNIRGAFVEFMGIKAYTPIGCSRLAADTGAAVVPMCTLRGDDGSYTFAIDPELPRIEAPDGSYDILANTKKQNDALSQMVFDHPDQWVWFHKRWETTPESLARFLEAKRQAKERAARPREARSRVKK